mgnify:CR=1 FL=1
MLGLASGQFFATQDVVTLLLSIPLLFVGLRMARKGSLRGQLLLVGGLGYMLYTYTSYAFGLAYNEFFLLYVALFALVLFTFILALAGLDVALVARKVSDQMPRRGIVLFLAGIAAFLTLAWLERIISAWLAGQPPYGLEANTTLTIQVLDLGFVVPVTVLASVLLWRKQAWGYTLAAILLIKALTMGAALIAMVVAEYLAGVDMSLVESLVVSAIAPVALFFTVQMFRYVPE